MRRLRREATVAYEFAGDPARLHLRDSEITELVRNATLGEGVPEALWLLSIDFERDDIVVHLAGVQTAVDHWLAYEHLADVLQRAVDQVTLR